MLGHVNGVHCTYYSCTMKFCIEKNCPVTQTMKGSAIDMLLTVQMSSGINMKNIYKFGFIYKFI